MLVKSSLMPHSYVPKPSCLPHLAAVQPVLAIQIERTILKVLSRQKMVPDNAYLQIRPIQNIIIFVVGNQHGCSDSFLEQHFLVYGGKISQPFAV